MSAPAACASAALSPTANTATRAVLPVPLGRLTVPRTIWSALRGSTPSRSATSTVGSNFVFVVFLASDTASAGLYRCSASICSAAERYALLRFMGNSSYLGEVVVLGPARGPATRGANAQP